MRPDARVQAAIEIIDQVLAEQTPADKIVTDYFRQRRYAGSKDRRAVREQVYRVLRSAVELQWRGAATTGRDLLLLELKLQETSPDELSDLFSGAQYAPEKCSEEEKTPLHLDGDIPDHVRGNYPDWLTPHLQARFGDQVDKEMLAMNGRAPLDIRVNTLKAERSEIIGCLQGDGVEAKPCNVSQSGIRCSDHVRLTDHAIYRDGRIEIQDESSQIAVQIANPQPGQTVIDFAAGAGGKSLALSAHMNNEGKIFALEVDSERLRRLKPRALRAGTSIIESVRIGDGDDDRWLAAHEGVADLVFLDAPCSGTGTWRRQVEQRLRFTQNDLNKYVQLQKRLLPRAWRLLKPGGVLCYATCSILLPEDEDQVTAFLDQHDDACAMAIEQSWHDKLNTSGHQILLTPARHETDGFFLARLGKKA